MKSGSPRWLHQATGDADGRDRGADAMALSDGVERGCCALCCALCFVSSTLLILTLTSSRTHVRSSSPGDDPRTASTRSHVQHAEDHHRRKKFVQENASIISDVRQRRSPKKLSEASATAHAALQLKAVRSFFSELERANRTSQGRRRETMQPPLGLVTTRKYSGRLQTGCVGGCFR